MKIYKEKDINSLTKKAADSITIFFKTNNKIPILFLTSGGSSFNVLNDINSDSLNENITISVIDERYSRESEINNYIQLLKIKFYKNALEKNCTFINTFPFEKESLDQFSNRFEDNLRSWKKINSNGKMIAILGIGPDGHTSGILPFPENPDLFRKLFIETPKWVTGYNAGKKNPYPFRATTTFPFIKLLDKTIVYITGENKRQAWNSLFNNTKDISAVPANIISKLNDTEVFTDIS